MDYKEKCVAQERAWAESGVEQLREASEKAFSDYGKAKGAYLDARDAYHKVLRQIWNSEDMAGQ